MRKLCSAAEIPEGGRKSFGAVTVFNVDGRYHACESRCPHMGYPMVKGLLRDGVLTCAWHNWEFDLQTGGCYRGACHNLLIHAIELRDGHLYLAEATAAPPLERLQALLREGLYTGDLYIQAKATAQLFGAGQSAREIAAFAAGQAFRHACIAHANEQAVYELRAIADAARLAELMDGEDRAGALLQGLRTAAGRSGDRVEVKGLPENPDAGRFAALLQRYTLDPSPLGLERLLRSAGNLAAGVSDLMVLEVATRPHLCVQPEVFAATCAVIEAGDDLGESLDPLKPALLGWTLGMSRRQPDAEAREAMAWLAEHGEEIRATAASHARAITASDLDTILDAHDIRAVFAGLLDLLRASDPTDVLGAFSLYGARRFAGLWLANGDLWEEADELLRLSHAARRAHALRPGTWLRPALFLLALAAFRRRWLKAPKLSESALAPATGTGARLAELFEPSNARAVRAEALALFEHSPFTEARRQLVALLVKEDLAPVQLRTLVCALGEIEAGLDFRPYIAGLVVCALDRKASREVQAAAAFGKSYLHGPPVVS